MEGKKLCDFMAHGATFHSTKRYLWSEVKDPGLPTLPYTAPLYRVLLRRQAVSGFAENFAGEVKARD